MKLFNSLFAEHALGSLDPRVVPMAAKLTDNSCSTLLFKLQNSKDLTCCANITCCTLYFADPFAFAISSQSYCSERTAKGVRAIWSMLQLQSAFRLYVRPLASPEPISQAPRNANEKHGALPSFLIHCYASDGLSSLPSGRHFTGT